MRLKDIVIAVDFDGTVVTHEYPQVGKDVGAVPVLRKMVAHGARIVLWTMRGDEELQDAVDWYAQHDIPLFGINENPEQGVWTNSPKAYANIYIDDAALGAPLTLDKSKSFRPFIDWTVVDKLIFPQ